MKAVAVVQARLGSTRLPGKVLRPLAGRAVLDHVLDRALAVPGVSAVVAAIPAGPENAPLAEALRRRADVTLYQGSEDDVLDRYYRAAKAAGADAVVRITSDCPLVDPEVTGRVLKALLDQKADYACNNRPPSYPHGLDVEAFTFAALEKAWQEAKGREEREHVTFFLTDPPGRFKVVNVASERNDHDLRLTLDHPSDFALLSAVFERLGPKAAWREVVALLRAEPALARLNADAKATHTWDAASGTWK